MRLWSIHPKYLDQKGLVAVWREALLAKKVLEGKTKGYKFHPQLERFKKATNPLHAINKYLEHIYLEASHRGYVFDKTKFSLIENDIEKISVTKGQLTYEFNHLLEKLKKRDPFLYEKLKHTKEIECHPSFYIVAGNVESWEIIKTK